MIEAEGDIRFGCVVWPQRAEAVCIALHESALVDELYAAECQGAGTRREGADDVPMGLLPKVLIGGVVAEEHRDAVVDIILSRARSGRRGDGKVLFYRSQACYTL